jgi:glycosyltransferase involved in cell wall biosynthesis
MKVLWVGDAAVSSGFARCTHAVCDELHRAGHEVHVLGINYFGDPHGYPYKIWPCLNLHDHGRELFGTDRLPRMIERLEPDAVVLLNDPWNVPQYLRSIRDYTDAKLRHGPIIGWLAVDAKNQRGAPLNDLDHVVVWTEFAADELRAGGYDGTPSVVPLGVDLDLFGPVDRQDARRIACPPGVPEDAFIVGVVGRNQPRKRLDLTIAYFADWVTRYNVDDAWLYLHVAPTGERSCDVLSLVHYHGVQSRVVLSEPDIGLGLPSGQMPAIYSAFDVYLSTTQGEGWGLPTLEAMACGVPCIVPDWSGLGSWTEDAAMKVACDSTALTAPMNAKAYTVGGVPSAKAVVWALNITYRNPDHREHLRERGLVMATRYPWMATGVRFRQVLEGVVGERQPEEVADAG